MATSKPQITQEDDVWVIRVVQANGKTQEFRCASEGQARQLAAVLSPREATP
jgi:hypothetical protein